MERVGLAVVRLPGNKPSEIRTIEDEAPGGQHIRGVGQIRFARHNSSAGSLRHDSPYSKERAIRSSCKIVARALCNAAQRVASRRGAPRYEAIITLLYLRLPSASFGSLRLSSRPRSGSLATARVLSRSLAFPRIRTYLFGLPGVRRLFVPTIERSNRRKR